MPTVETLMLANHAEAVNGLLYIHGGGWTHHWRARGEGDQVPASQIALAVTFLVSPSEAAAGPGAFTIRLVFEATGEEVVRFDGTFDVAVEPGNPPANYRMPLAANLSVPFPHTGRYTARAEAAGNERAVEFWVHDQAPGAGPEQTPGHTRVEPMPGYM